MSHFHFNLRSLFAPPVARHESWRRSLDELPANEDVELTKGPGWFDSSFALSRGLEVREDFSGEPAMRAWLEIWLRSDPPAKRRRAAKAADVTDVTSAGAAPDAGGARVVPAGSTIDDGAFAAYDIDDWSLVPTPA